MSILASRNINVAFKAIFNRKKFLITAAFKKLKPTNLNLKRLNGKNVYKLSNHSLSTPPHSSWRSLNNKIKLLAIVKIHTYIKTLEKQKTRRVSLFSLSSLFPYTRMPETLVSFGCCVFWCTFPFSNFIISSRWCVRRASKANSKPPRRKYLCCLTRGAFQEWNDYNLRWNESEYGGVKDLRITPNKLWKPDVLMYNR